MSGDWKLWANLQFTENLQIIRDEHPCAGLAKRIWNAAGKLSVHPGPLNDALQHIDCLINGVLENLATYQSTKEQAGLVDYGDMVHLANGMLADHPQWLDEIASGYDCLIIDEFQDTNPLQYALLSQFQASSKYTFIVGDLKQSIMGFQGSDSRLFAALLKEGEQTLGVVKELGGNWRSTPALMDFINAMGTALYGGQYQQLDPEAGYESELPSVQTLNFRKELWNQHRNARSPRPGFTAEGNTALANHISDLLGSGKKITDRHSGEKRPIRGADIAILARGHSRLGKMAEALRNSGLDVHIQQPGFLACDAVQWALNALQALSNGSDQYAWLDLLTSPLVNGHNTDRLKELLVSFTPTKGLQHQQKDELEALGKKLRKLAVKTQLLALIEAARLFETLNKHPQGQQYRANLIKLIGLAEEYEALQPETLNAMGIAGKSASTFLVWLNQNKDCIDEQPSADPQAENAIILKTWHSSKGLEWPIVMVLDAEKTSKPRFPNIAMAYPEGSVDSMLQQSFVQILPQFDDKLTKERFAERLVEEQTETNKNLYYVALTRAREQIILPCWENYSDGSMLSYIEPVLSAQAEKGKPKPYEEKTITPSDANSREGSATAAERIGLFIDRKESPSKLQHTISPSLSKGQKLPGSSGVQTTAYSPVVNLDVFDGIPAHELGTWVHRLYQVYVMQPKLLNKALAMRPGCIVDEEFQKAVVAHLEGFKKHITQTVHAELRWECEVPVVGMSRNMQVESGVIDLLVEGKDGWWLIDHKTDSQSETENYIEQLLAYQRMCSGLKIEGLAINWSRRGQLDVVSE